MKFRFFGSGGRVQWLMFRMKHAVKVLNYNRLHKIGG